MRHIGYIRGAVLSQFMSQVRYWSITIPHEHFTPFLPLSVAYIKGQLERAASGYLHWQVMCILKRSERRNVLSRIFGEKAHLEPSRSDALSDYVWKEDTRIDGTQFELGKRPVNRSDPRDWDAILSSAKAGEFDKIPADIQVRCYSNLQKIAASNMSPIALEKVTPTLIRKSTYSGELQEQVSPVLPGSNQDLTPIRKFQLPSSGTDTVVRKMSSLTNSEAVSISPICCDGPIDTPCPSRLKDQSCLCRPKRCGLHPTCTQKNGTQHWTRRLKRRSSEDLMSQGTINPFKK